MKFCSVYFQILLWATSGLVLLTFSSPIDKAMSKRSSQSSHKANCSAIPGAVQKNNIRNSAYFLLANGTLCCPPKNCPVADKDMAAICGETRGVVNEPCYDCKTCGKIKGESCHGVQFQNGECGDKFSCINVNGTVLEFEYDEGICTDKGGAPTNLQPGESCGGKFGYLGTCESESHCTLKQDKNYGVCEKNAKTKTLMQKCGGPYGIHGRCADELRCSVLEDEFLKGVDISGVCFSNRSAEVCFKDCSGRNTDVVCGDNGTWYHNICYLRQANCYLAPGKLKVRKDETASSCDENTKPAPRQNTISDASSSSPNANSSNSNGISSNSGRKNSS